MLNTDAPNAIARYKNKCVTLNGPKALSMVEVVEVVELLNKLVIREINIRPVSAD